MKIVLTKDDGTQVEFVEVRPVPVPEPTPTPVPPPAPAPPQNVGVNLARWSYYMTARPYKDFGRLTSKWHGQSNSSGWDKVPLGLDPTGKLLSIPAGAYAAKLVDFSPSDPNGMLISWTGPADAVRVTGAVRVDERLLRWERGASNRLMLTVTEPVEEIHLFWANNTFSDSHNWRPEYLKRLSNFRVLRFMDALRINERHVLSGGAWGLAKQDMQELSPLDESIDLCNRTQSAMWWCVHDKANADAVKTALRSIRGSLDHPLYLEYSNELWNGIFPQSKDLVASAKTLTGGDWMSLHWKATENLSALSKEICPAYVVHAEQCAGLGRFDYWAKSKSIRWEEKIHGMAIAPYFGHSVGKFENLVKIREGGADWILDQCRIDLEKTLGQVAAWKEWCDARKIHLVGYEGGMHAVPAVQFDPPEYDDIRDAFVQANRSPVMGGLYTKLLQEWTRIAGKHYPLCLYHDCGPVHKRGCWGLIEHEGDLNNPKYQAVLRHVGAVQ